MHQTVVNKRKGSAEQPLDVGAYKKLLICPNGRDQETSQAINAIPQQSDGHARTPEGQEGLPPPPPLRPLIRPTKQSVTQTPPRTNSKMALITAINTAISESKAEETRLVLGKLKAHFNRILN